MDFSTKPFDAKNTIAAAKSGCVVVGVYDNQKLSQAARALDQKGDITAAVKSGDISGKPGTTLLMRGVAGVNAERVLLVGLGKEDETSAKDFTSAMQAVARVFSTLGANDALIALPFDGVQERDAAWAVQAASRCTAPIRSRARKIRSRAA
jgi:leucyl aminopeptidase